VPRKVVGDPRTQQLLIRLTSDELEVLESAAHLNRQTPASYSYALIQSHVASLRSDPFIARDLQNRREFANSLASAVPLPTRSQGPSRASPHQTRPASEAAAINVDGHTGQ
jgi:hypothetical protein